jgi:hypothetical protein
MISRRKFHFTATESSIMTGEESTTLNSVISGREFHNMIVVARLENFNNVFSGNK